MTQSKQFNITLINRFKRAMKILGHFSFLFLVGISTYKTPAFAQDSIQGTCSNTKISLPIFFPFEEVRAAMKKVDSRYKPRLVKDGSKLKADGKIEHSDARGRVELWINPKFKEDWDIELGIERDVSVSEARGFFGLASFRERTKRDIRGIIDRNASRISKYINGKRGLKKIFQEAWSALNVVEKVSQDPPIWLVVTPRAFAVTQPRVASTGIYLNFVAEAETGLKTGTAPARSASDVQLPSTLRILTASQNLTSDVAMPISINFGTYNLLIEGHPGNKPEKEEKPLGTIELDKIVLVPAVRDSFPPKAVISLEPSGCLERLWFWVTGKEVYTQHIVLTGKPTPSSEGEQVPSINASPSSEGVTRNLLEDFIQNNASKTLIELLTRLKGNCK